MHDAHSRIFPREDILRLVLLQGPSAIWKAWAKQSGTELILVSHEERRHALLQQQQAEAELWGLLEGWALLEGTQPSEERHRAKAIEIQQRIRARATGPTGLIPTSAGVRTPPPFFRLVGRKAEYDRYYSGGGDFSRAEGTFLGLVLLDELLASATTSSVVDGAAFNPVGAGAVGTSLASDSSGGSTSSEDEGSSAEKNSQGRVQNAAVLRPFSAAENTEFLAKILRPFSAADTTPRIRRREYAATAYSDHHGLVGNKGLFHTLLREYLATADELERNPGKSRKIFEEVFAALPLVESKPVKLPATLATELDQHQRNERPLREKADCLKIAVLGLLRATIFSERSAGPMLVTAETGSEGPPLAAAMEALRMAMRESFFQAKNEGAIAVGDPEGNGTTAQDPLSSPSSQIGAARPGTVPQALMRWARDDGAFKALLGTTDFEPLLQLPLLQGQSPSTRSVAEAAAAGGEHELALFTVEQLEQYKFLSLLDDDGVLYLIERLFEQGCAEHRDPREVQNSLRKMGECKRHLLRALQIVDFVAHAVGATR